MGEEEGGRGEVGGRGGGGKEALPFSPLLLVLGAGGILFLLFFCRGEKERERERMEVGIGIWGW